MTATNATRAAGSSAPDCSAWWQFRHEVSWTPLRQWHPAFRRAWWIGGQIGKYANDAYTVGIRICGLFVAVWWFLPNKPGERICEPSAGSKYAPLDGSETGGAP